MGASAEHKILDYIHHLEPGTTFLEIGATSPPSNMGSTSKLYDIAIEHDFIFHSVDIDKDNIDALVIEDPRLERVMTVDWGEHFLKYFDGPPISFAYLDNFDWMYAHNLHEFGDLDNHPEWRRQVELYDRWGSSMNNVNSQVSHLRQTMLIDKLASDKCIILYDDTWFDETNQIYMGKGGASICYLLGMGWGEIHFDRSDLVVPEQAIMVGTGDICSNI